jgi:hypothetical protein
MGSKANKCASRDLGTMSSNDDSISRKIEIRSVLEILVFANGKLLSRFRELEERFQPTQPRLRFNLTDRPYDGSEIFVRAFLHDRQFNAA